jgi:hypothetical protein
MATTQKKIASHLAKALAELGKAVFLSTGKPMAPAISEVAYKLSLIFHSTGYEFSDADSVRIKKSKA